MFEEPKSPFNKSQKQIEDELKAKGQWGDKDESGNIPEGKTDENSTVQKPATDDFYSGPLGEAYLGTQAGNPASEDKLS